MTAAYSYDDQPDDGQTKPPKTHKHLETLRKAITVSNLAEGMEDNDLARIGRKVVEGYELDLNSRKAKGWDDRNKAAMDLAMQVKEVKNFPWPNASNVKYPLISTAAIQFNARALPALIDGPNIVKGKVLGQSSEEKVDRADRIGRHMSYQLLDEMDGWQEDTDRLLMMLPIVGCVFRKSYFDPTCGYNVSRSVAPEDFVVDYFTRDLDSCPRATHVLKFYPYEIKERQLAGIWLDHDFGQAQDADNDDQAPHVFLEQHCLFDLDGDDYPEPYIVTVHEESGKVVRIVARYDEKGIVTAADGTVVRIKPVRAFTKYPFIPSPDGAFYDIGYGTLLHPLSDTINTTINQMIDAATLANAGGGFIGDGVSIKSGSLRFSMGEFKKVTTNGQALKDNIFPITAPQPSQVLFNLLQMLIESAKDVTSTKDILTGDTGGANMPVGTVMAAIEQGLKTYTAIIKRIHRSLGEELEVLYRLNSIYLKESDYFSFQDQEGAIARKDYNTEDIDVIPVSDPTMATDAQKAARGQFLMQFAPDPTMDHKEILTRVLEAANIQDIDTLWAKGPPPVDPKVAIAAQVAEHKQNELNLKAEDQKTKDALANANISLIDAQTEQIMSQVALSGPQFLLEVQQAIDARLAHLEGLNADAVQQGAPGGVAAPPGHPGVPPVPAGPAGGPGGAMGVGSPMGPAGANQGPPPGPVGPPGMA